MLYLGKGKNTRTGKGNAYFITSSLHKLADKAECIGSFKSRNDLFSFLHGKRLDIIDLGCY